METAKDGTAIRISRRDALAGAGAVALAAGIGARPAAAMPAFTHVADFTMQVTGVGVSPNGRIFVNFPRWEQDVPISVAEVMKDGTLKPYPDAEWNSWSNLNPKSLGDHFVCVQSVVVDPTGKSLWVIDPAAPGNEFIKPGGVKLVQIDLATDKVVRVYPFGPDLAPQGSYMNDVRFSPDAKTAYLTDSGQVGALIVLDTATGKGRRVLSGDPRTQPDLSVKPVVDGHVLRRPDNRIPSFAADGIAVSPDGKYVYWQVLVGDTLYRMPTAVLDDASKSPADVAAAVETLGKTVQTDGLWMDQGGYLYITDPKNNAVQMRDPSGKLTMIAQDARLRWPDSMAEGADGSIYITASHIQDMAQFHTHGSTQQGPWQLFKIAKPHS